ncbi:vesicular, overexpressed in cancer, prosurvival protein 1-like [Haliotis rubra]|uniref:vesicular, overexpressed in cancer, prosurvival protein 1-like n=1 Tax=Haliotis rubra TaxID=36100 RepID=UPI001EE5B92A|nr:vesicular, overexpressed in cancer, prosurvival protein 1-like [Haliotis rubra]
MDSLLIILFSAVLVEIVEGKQCWHSSQGRTKVFYCADSQICCDQTCCSLNQAFYKLWYFWLTVLLLLLLCVAGIYWIRRNYIYHKLLALSAWSSQHLVTSLNPGNVTTAPKKNTRPKVPNELIHLPPYTPQEKPPPYTEYDVERPPLYSSTDVAEGEKACLVEQRTE